MGSKTEYMRKWRKEHAEHCKEYQAAYYKANRERLKAYKAQHYREHMEEHKTRIERWKDANPEKIREYSRRQNERRKALRQEQKEKEQSDGA